MAVEDAVVFAVAIGSPEHCNSQLLVTGPQLSMEAADVSGNVLMVRSMEPEAIRLPVGSNLAAKISPEWPDSSMTGAWRLLVRGAVWIRSPLLPVALVLVRARLEPRLGLLTS